MREPKSYYELLGVSRTATADEIRAAYLRLMKRHHPDAAAHHDGAPDFVPLLNRCYAVLRDPVKRSQHDAQIVASSSMPVTPPRLHTLPRQTGKCRRGEVVLFVGAVAFSLSWVVLDLVAERMAPALTATAAGWLSRPPARTTNMVLRLPDRQVIQRMAALARTVSTRNAEDFSRECFATASRQLTTSIADSCVVFDTAFLYWRQTPVSTSDLSAYFADEVVDDRHNELATVYGASAHERLASLREAAFQALIRGLQVPPSASLASSEADDNMVIPSELLHEERERLAAASVP